MPPSNFTSEKLQLSIEMVLSKRNLVFDCPVPGNQTDSSRLRLSGLRSDHHVRDNPRPWAVVSSLHSERYWGGMRVDSRGYAGSAVRRGVGVSPKPGKGEDGKPYSLCPCAHTPIPVSSLWCPRDVPLPNYTPPTTHTTL